MCRSSLNITVSLDQITKISFSNFRQSRGNGFENDWRPSVRHRWLLRISVFKVNTERPVQSVCGPVQSIHLFDSASLYSPAIGVDEETFVDDRWWLRGGDPKQRKPTEAKSQLKLIRSPVVFLWKRTNTGNCFKNKTQKNQ